MQEIVVPLVHDTEFYSLLSGTLKSISEHMTALHSDFVNTLQVLSKTIGDSSHPASVSASFQPLSSITTHAGSVRVKTGELKVCPFVLILLVLLTKADNRATYIFGERFFKFISRQRCLKLWANVREERGRWKRARSDCSNLLSASPRMGLGTGESSN